MNAVTSKNHLREIAANVQRQLIANLAEGEPIKHPGTKGANSEKVWIELFDKYLPNRFRVASATIIDSTGQVSDQIDCVIFDAHFTPQIIPNEASLYIPIEAVHAIFEIKQQVNAEHLEYAAKKLQSVRRLYRTSTDYIGDGRYRKAKPLFHILGGLLGRSMTWREGFKSESFLSALNNARGVEHLDFVFAAESGYADMVKTSVRSKYRDTNRQGIPTPVIGPTALSYGLFRILEELIRQGTVPAVDWSEYYDQLVR